MRKLADAQLEKLALWETSNKRQKNRAANRAAFDEYLKNNPPKDPEKAKALYNLLDDLQHGPVRVRLNRPLQQLPRKDAQTEKLAYHPPAFLSSEDRLRAASTLVPEEYRAEQIQEEARKTSTRPLPALATPAEIRSGERFGGAVGGTIGGLGGAIMATPHGRRVGAVGTVAGGTIGALIGQALGGASVKNVARMARAEAQEKRESAEAFLDSPDLDASTKKIIYEIMAEKALEETAANEKLREMQMRELRAQSQDRWERRLKEYE